MELDIRGIMELIPHRPPFLLIDRVTALEPGVSARAIKNVSMNEPFFVGHFPGEPVMPGVLIIEAMAQTGAVALMSMEQFKGKTAYFGAIDKAKFRKKVVPGDTLTLELTVTKLRGSAGIGQGVAFVDGTKVCEAELTFLIG